MTPTTRRQFMDSVGRGMLVAGLGAAVSHDLGFSTAFAAEGPETLKFGPYDALVADHRDVTCGMNLAWAEGVVEGLGARDVTVELAPEPGRCCVVFHAAAGGHHPGA